MLSFLNNILHGLLAKKKRVDRNELMRDRLLILVKKYEGKLEKSDLRPEFDQFSCRLRRWFIKSLKLSGQITYTRLKRDIDKYDLDAHLKERIKVLCNSMIELEYKADELSVDEIRTVLSHVRFIATEF